MVLKSLIIRHPIKDTKDLEIYQSYLKVINMWAESKSLQHLINLIILWVKKRYGQ